MSTIIAIVLVFVAGFGVLLVTLVLALHAAEASAGPDKASPSDKYALEWRDDSGYGSGYVVKRLADRQRLSWQTLPVGDGLRAFNVAGTSHRQKAVGNHRFGPGSRLVLVREPDNEHDPDAVAVWSEDRKLMAGYVPREMARRVWKDATAEPPPRVISMWRGNGSLRALVIAADASVYVPT